MQGAGAHRHARCRDDLRGVQPVAEGGPFPRRHGELVGAPQRIGDHVALAMRERQPLDA